MERRLAAILAADVAGYSRLMREDEAGTLATLQSHYTSVIAPAIARHHGRVVKLMGDGVLAEFGSIVECIECAAVIQNEIAARNSSEQTEKQMVLRIGVHLGDIIVEGDDIFGDGVNIAARLQQIADHGGVCISRQAYDQIDRKLALRFQALGPKRLKNIADAIEVYALKSDVPGTALDRPKIQYCRAPDGVRLAYAISGKGPPLVKTANWLNHLEHDWDTPVWRQLFHELSRDYTLLRYDARGNGLSDWDVTTLSFEAWVNDLGTVVDAAGLDRFPLLGISQGCPIAIAYTVLYPQRVSHLILYGGFALGANKRSPQEQQKRQALSTLMRLEWGSDSPAFRQMFTMQFIPDATKEQADSFNELQRRSASPEGAARYLEVVSDVDVTGLLAKVSVPTLVLHARDDLRVPYENGQQMAANIPGARFVALQGRNHILLENEPATKRFFEEIRLFLAG